MPLVRVCPHCGVSNPPELEECHRCGADLGDVPTRELSAMMPAGDPNTRAPRRVEGEPPAPARSTGGVVITGIEIGVYDLMMLLIKLAIASIPATIILTIIGAFIFAVLVAIRGA